MERSIQAIIQDIRQLPESQEYLSQLRPLVDELERHKQAATAIEALFALFEQFPERDFGSPGPLVHFLERFWRKGYEEHLFESLRRKPTELTVWMLNRLINGEEGTVREHYMSIMRQLSTTDGQAGNSAREFLRHQGERS